MNVSAEVVYLLCMATSLLCSLLLFRAYRKSGTRLLMWSAICFACLCLNNILLFLDLIVFTTSVDLSMWRLIPALVGVALLCYGFIEEEA
jgi:hypothetical protein